MKHSILFGLLVLLFAGCATTPIAENEEAPEEEIQSTKRIVAFGDSLTEGYELPHSESYPAQLQQKLREEGYEHYEVINAGVSGETSSGALSRVDFIIELEPDIVILETGGNDGLRGVDLELTRSNIDSILQRLLEADTTVIFAGMEITENLGQQYVQQFKSMYAELSQQYDVIFLPFFLEGVAGNIALNLDDQIHPNAKGYAIIVEDNIWPVLEPLLEQGKGVNFSLVHRFLRY